MVVVAVAAVEIEVQTQPITIDAGIPFVYLANKMALLLLLVEDGHSHLRLQHHLPVAASLTLNVLPDGKGRVIDCMPR